MFLGPTLLRKPFSAPKKNPKSKEMKQTMTI